MASDYQILFSLIINYQYCNVVIDPALRPGNPDSFLLKIKHLHHKQIVTITPPSYTDPNLYFQIYDKDSHFFTYKDHLNISNYRESLF